MAKKRAAAQMSQSQIQSQLNNDGYSNLRNWQHTGDTYQVTADDNGQAVTLTVDARNGNVISKSSS